MRQKAAALLSFRVEAVEKVPKQVLGQDTKSYLMECATINDLMPGKNQVPLENPHLIGVRGFF